MDSGYDPAILKVDDVDFVPLGGTDVQDQTARLGIRAEDLESGGKAHRNRLLRGRIGVGNVGNGGIHRFLNMFAGMVSFDDKSCDKDRQTNN